jgi:hypothetical protein
MASRKYTLKQMLTGEPDEPPSIIPKLVAMGGGGGGFSGTTMPGAPINPPQTGDGQIDMSGWAELLKKLMNPGGDKPEELGWPDGNYPEIEPWAIAIKK